MVCIPKHFTKHVLANFTQTQQADAFMCHFLPSQIELLENMRSHVQAAWRTDEIRRSRPTPQVGQATENAS
jgi:phosphoenolpyruvate carboxylase